MQYEFSNAAGSAGDCAIGYRSDGDPPLLSADGKTSDQQTYTFGAWTNQDVTVTIHGFDGWDGVGINSIRYAASGGQTIGLTFSGYTVDADGYDVTATATPTVSAEGHTTFGYGESDFNGNDATTSMDIRIDKTPPVVTWSGRSASGNYTVDQQVNISCSATDPTPPGVNEVSGVQSSQGCVGENKPAYMFQEGPTTLSGSSTDNAGNTASNAVHFNVLVTFATLETLTSRLFSNLAGPLNTKLALAQSAQNQGKYSRASTYLQQYRSTLSGIHTVAAQRLSYFSTFL